MNSESKKTLDAIYGVKEMDLKPENGSETSAMLKYPKITGEIYQTIALSPRRHVSKIIIQQDNNE